MKKRQEELAQVTDNTRSKLLSRCSSRIFSSNLVAPYFMQEKAANAMILASDTVRWIMGPSGTTVTFPNEVGLPSIFDHKPYRYIHTFLLQIQFVRFRFIFFICIIF